MAFVAFIATANALAQGQGAAEAGTQPRTQGRRLLDEVARERGASPDPAANLPRPAAPTRAEVYPPRSGDPFAPADMAPRASNRPRQQPAAGTASRGIEPVAFHEPIAGDDAQAVPVNPDIDADVGTPFEAAPDDSPLAAVHAAEQTTEVAPAADADLLPVLPAIPDTSVADPGTAAAVAATAVATRSETKVPTSTEPALELAPRSNSDGNHGQQGEAANGEDAPAGSPLTTMLGSLALVLALFFAVVWIMRRAMPASSRQLPLDVLDVLGRTPLPGKQQQLQIVRFGSKLLLLASSPSGVQSLGEIADPDEVDQLVRRCRGERLDIATSTQLEPPASPKGYGHRLDEPSENAATALARRMGRTARWESSDA